MTTNLAAVQQYKEQTIQTMTKGELLILLFDECLKNLNMAVMMIEQKNYPTLEKCTQKCIEIFNYLSIILDRQYPLSMELYQLYTFLNQEIIRAEIKRQPGILEPLISIVEEMRQTWSDADKLAHMNKK